MKDPQTITAYGLKMFYSGKPRKSYLYLPSINMSRQVVIQKMRADWMRTNDKVSYYAKDDTGKMIPIPNGAEKAFQDYLKDMGAVVVKILITVQGPAVSRVRCKLCRKLVDRKAKHRHVKRAKPDCSDCLDLGFLHMTSGRGREIQTCDMCRRLKTDEDAVQVHAQKCSGCSFIETGKVPD